MGLIKGEDGERRLMAGLSLYLIFGARLLKIQSFESRPTFAYIL